MSIILPTYTVAQEIPHGIEEDDADVQAQVWICVLDLETSKSRRLFAVPEIAIAGSPAVSSDETKIAFDGSTPGLNSTSQAELFIASIDGSDIQKLGRAAMPSWSPDGTRMLISQYGPMDHGVWNLKSDCSDAQPLDQTGWSGQWSPDGKSIVYLKAKDLIVHDVASETRRSLLGDESSQYTRIYFNPAWSAESDRVYFKAQRKDGSSEICSKSLANGGKVQIHIQRATYANIAIAFDGRIIVPFRSKVHGTVQLHSFDGSKQTPSIDADAIHVQGQYAERSSYGASMSLDRKRLYYVSVPPSEEDHKAQATILRKSAEEPK